MDITELYESFTPDVGRAARHRKIDDDAKKNPPKDSYEEVEELPVVNRTSKVDYDDEDVSAGAIIGSLVVDDDEEDDDEEDETEYTEADMEVDLMSATALLEKAHTLFSRLYADHLLNNFGSYPLVVANSIRDLRDEIEKFNDSILS